MLRVSKMCLVIGAALIVSASASEAANYYLSPGGSDSNSGASTGQAWGTLQYAGSRLSAGDTLFIMGGTYTDAQYFHDEGGSLRGTASEPVVFKAYGDSPAVFVSTGPNPLGRWYTDYFMFTSGNSDYIVIDGFGSIAPYAPLYLRFEGHEEAHNLIRFSGNSSNYCEHITVRGIEVDGGHTSAFAGTGGDDVAVGIVVEYCRMSEFTDNYIHHIHHPTGPIPPGDGSDRVQSTGHGIYVYSSELCLIQNNRIERCNHGAMEIEIQRPSGHPARYMRIIGNVIEQYYGGGIYLPFNAHHNLIENNIITHCGETTDFGKPGIQLSGSNNTLRGNVIFNPNNQPLRLEAQTAIGFHYITDDNLIYNNTLFGSRYNLGILVKNVSDPDCSAEGNLFANNILYRSTGAVEDSGGREAEITIDLYGANDEHNWCDPNATGCYPDGTHWGGNAFLNNLIRRNAEGGDYARLVLWARDATYGGGWTEWNIPELQANDATAWSGNIGLDPLIRSEDPDSYGIANGWWRISEGSPAIDAGIPVVDNLGSYVEDLYPGYGWTDRAFGGTAPDMGAHEFNSEEPSPLSGPRISIEPGTRF